MIVKKYRIRNISIKVSDGWVIKQSLINILHYLVKPRIPFRQLPVSPLLSSSPLLIGLFFSLAFSSTKMSLELKFSSTSDQDV